MSGGSEEFINGALDVVHFSILLSFERNESSQSDPREILDTSPILSVVVCFVGILNTLFPIT